jgi:uncharacterized protein (TIGR03546 family)
MLYLDNLAQKQGNKEGILLLKAIGKLIYALNSNMKKSQIAAGIAWGVLLGLIPVSSIFFLVLFLVSFFFSHNHGSKIFGMALVKLISPLIALTVDQFGWWVLHIDALQPLFTTMYNMPFVPFTKFNNTLVAGGIIGGAVLWLPVFFLFMGFIPLYRNTIAPKIRNLKFVQAIAKSPLLKIVDKIMKD